MTSPGWVLSPHEFGPAVRDFQHRLNVKAVVTVLDFNHRGSSCCWWNQFCPAVRACTMFTQPSVQTLGVEELWTAPRWYWKNVSVVGSLINILATPISPHPPQPWVDVLRGKWHIREFCGDCVIFEHRASY